MFILILHIIIVKVSVFGKTRGLIKTVPVPLLIMKIRGVYKYNGNIPPPRGGGIPANAIWKIYEKGEQETEENLKEKERASKGKIEAK